MPVFRLALCLFPLAAAFAQSLAITDVVVYPSASESALRRATVLINDGKIQAVGEHVSVPAGLAAIRCSGCALVAGFWNGHVHFTEPKWDGASNKPAKQLTDQLRVMLARSGFTSVVDTGSLLSNTLAIRRRIDSGEVLGPRILTAGLPIYPPNGIPFYVKDGLSPELLRELTPPNTVSDAVSAVERNIRDGADIVKLFTGSWITRDTVLPMPKEIAIASAQAAHRNGKLVFSHPSNLLGVRIAIDSGVDVLAHTPEDTRGVDQQILETAVQRGMAMIPTLKLFSGDRNISEIRRVVWEFENLGGSLVFGTDTGYLTDYDVSEEFKQLGKANLTWRDVLRMLTENPARLFKDQTNRGRVVPGMIADLTILETDPAVDPSAFWLVRYTIKNGRVIWESN
ncbi:MAG: amidohydrolase family protein [Acidobacteriia bacterium]|nr:amidohydrolase family protein [Terriglobia bacterium]